MRSTGLSHTEGMTELSHRPAIRAAVALSLFAGSALAARRAALRTDCPAGRLLEALLQSEKLAAANGKSTESPDAALADCAAYVADVARTTSRDFLGRNAASFSGAVSRSSIHPFTGASGTVLFRPGSGEHRLVYALSIPEVGEVRGERCVRPIRLSGITPARPMPDILQIALATGYVVQFETEFEVPDFVVTRDGVLGTALMYDSAGNFGRLQIDFDGTVTGTVTRGALLVGRFDGATCHGVRYRALNIPQAA